MKVIGFNFTKISSERGKIPSKTSISTNIEFTEVDREKVELLKDSEPLRVNFKCSWVYSDAEKKETKFGDVSFEGNIILAAEKEEAKEILKSWKKKKLSPSMQIPLFNLILKKCTPKAAHFADEIALPSPIPLPKIKPQSSS
jgi:hypothetical protein